MPQDMSSAACRLEELVMPRQTLKIWLVIAGRKANRTQRTKTCKTYRSVNLRKTV